MAKERLLSLFQPGELTKSDFILLSVDILSDILSEEQLRPIRRAYLYNELDTSIGFLEDAIAEKLASERPISELDSKCLKNVQAVCVIKHRFLKPEQPTQNISRRFFESHLADSILSKIENPQEGDLPTKYQYIADFADILYHHYQFLIDNDEAKIFELTRQPRYPEIRRRIAMLDQKIQEMKRLQYLTIPSADRPLGSREFISELLTEANRNLMFHDPDIFEKYMVPREQDDSISQQKDRGERLQNPPKSISPHGIFRADQSHLTPPSMRSEAELTYSHGRKYYALSDSTRILDEYDIDDTVSEGYSRSQPDVPFVNSISGSSYLYVTTLIDHLEVLRENEIPDDVINQRALDLTKAFIASVIANGYHSYKEVTDVFNDEPIRELFEDQGIINVDHLMHNLISDAELESQMKASCQYVTRLQAGKHVNAELLAGSHVLRSKDAAKATEKPETPIAEPAESMQEETDIAISDSKPKKGLKSSDRGKRE